MEEYTLNEINHFFRNIKIILLTPHGRSGSIFLQSLFDGHPNVYTLPGYLNYPNFLNPQKSIKEALNLFIKNNQGLFNVYKTMFSGSFSDKDHQPALIDEIDIEEFKKNFLDLCKCFCISNNVDFVIAVHFVFMSIKAVNFKSIKTIMIHLHDYEQNFYLKDRTIKNVRFSHEIFLNLKNHNVKMIALIRNPLESYYSFSKISKNHGIDYFLRIKLITLKCYYYLFKNMMSYGIKNFYILDLGDLHRSNVFYLKELCHFIGIDYDNCLNHSTINGHDWYGISSSHLSSNTFDQAKSVLKYPEYLYKSEYKDYFCMVSFLFFKINIFMNFKQEKYNISDYCRSMLSIFFSCFRFTNFQQRKIINEHLPLLNTHKYLNYILNKNLALKLSNIFCKILNSNLISRLALMLGRLKIYCMLFFYKIRISSFIKEIRE